MVLRWWFERGTRLAGAPGASQLTVARDEWRQAAENIAAGGGRLLAQWASTNSAERDVVHAAFIAETGVLVLNLPLADSDEYYPGIEQLFPAANRMQRAIADLSGLRASDVDRRAWLRHAAWPSDFHPLKDTHSPPTIDPPKVDDYAFVRVEGEGVHEIAVGPVHAGTIEPGHFRFSIVGEKVLKLEERLGYAHKGIERRFTQLPLREGHTLAARISGDSAVAYSWAYCQALEGIAETAVPGRAAWLRALALEFERIANHLGDLGALGNDAGFAFGLAQFSRLKEQLLRAGEAAFGQRYLMDFIVPGGVRADLQAIGAKALSDTVEQVAAETERLRTIYDEHAGLRDRFNGAGIVEPSLAARLGLTGLAGRASGQHFDLRVDLPWEPYNEIAPKKVSRVEGDVAARVAVRFDEVKESARLVRILLKHMPGGPLRVELPTPVSGAMGVGLIEGWRGPAFIALEANENGGIRRCHPQDPSWQNWPVLEHAILGNIVPDFPLINKSFNLSYSGHDV
jgi:Ni,Fe-hydrogenase III large subunit/Ni,Fe-hydrogenase III component G